MNKVEDIRERAAILLQEISDLLKRFNKSLNLSEIARRNMEELRQKESSLKKWVDNLEKGEAENMVHEIKALNAEFDGYLEELKKVPGVLEIIRQVIQTELKRRSKPRKSG